MQAVMLTGSPPSLARHNPCRDVTLHFLKYTAYRLQGIFVTDHEAVAISRIIQLQEVLTPHLGTRATVPAPQ
jgi:hypothetical protein